MQAWQDFVQRSNGDAVPNAFIVVHTWPADVLATIYASDSTSDPITSQLRADANGRYEFYAADGKYKVYITGDSIEQQTREIILFDQTAGTSSLSIGYTPAGTGAVVSTVQTKLRESVSVKDFGAVGDGVTDDTAAIQAALNSLTLGGEVILPVGGYLISSTLTITKPITLRGQVRENQTLSRIFKKSTLNGPAISITTSNVSLQNFALTGQAGNGGNGITILGQYWELKNLTINTMGQDGVRVGDSAVATNCNIGSMFGVNTFSNTRHGIYLDSFSTDAGGATFLSCFSILNGGDGFKFDKSQLNTLIGCVSENNTGYGLEYAAGARDITWFGGDSEANTAGQFLRTPGCLRCNVQASWVNDGIGARVYNNANLTIANTTSTALTFNSEYWNTDSIHSTSVNTSRLTCTTAGKYVVTLNAGFNANATGFRSYGIKLNASTFIAMDTRPAFVGDTNHVCVSTLVSLGVGDYVEAFVYQNSGGALDIIAFNQATPVFSMVRQN